MKSMTMLLLLLVVVVVVGDEEKGDETDMFDRFLVCLFFLVRNNTRLEITLKNSGEHFIA